jgi:hypothetical protein
MADPVMDVEGVLATPDLETPGALSDPTDISVYIRDTLAEKSLSYYDLMSAFGMTPDTVVALDHEYDWSADVEPGIELMRFIMDMVRVGAVLYPGSSVFVTHHALREADSPFVIIAVPAMDDDMWERASAFGEVQTSWQNVLAWTDLLATHVKKGPDGFYGVKHQFRRTFTIIVISDHESAVSNLEKLPSWISVHTLSHFSLDQVAVLSTHGEFLTTAEGQRQVGETALRYSKETTIILVGDKNNGYPLPEEVERLHLGANRLSLTPSEAVMWSFFFPVFVVHRSAASRGLRHYNRISGNVFFDLQEEDASQLHESDEPVDVSRRYVNPELPVHFLMAAATGKSTLLQKLRPLYGDAVIEEDDLLTGEELVSLPFSLTSDELLTRFVNERRLLVKKAFLDRNLPHNHIGFFHSEPSSIVTESPAVRIQVLGAGRNVSKKRGRISNGTVEALAKQGPTYFGDQVNAASLYILVDLLTA